MSLLFARHSYATSLDAALPLTEAATLWLFRAWRQLSRSGPPARRRSVGDPVRGTGKQR